MNNPAVAGVRTNTVNGRSDGRGTDQLQCVCSQTSIVANSCGQRQQPAAIVNLQQVVACPSIDLNPIDIARRRCNIKIQWNPDSATRRIPVGRNDHRGLRSTATKLNQVVAGRRNNIHLIQTTIAAQGQITDLGVQGHHVYLRSTIAPSQKGR